MDGLGIYVSPLPQKTGSQNPKYSAVSANRIQEDPTALREGVQT